jgi:hypothetical protein
MNIRVLKINGAKYLYDESFQTPDPIYVNLWDVALCEICKFERAVARTVAKSIDSKGFESAMFSFNEWKNSEHGKLWRKSQLEKLESARRASDNLREIEKNARAKIEDDRRGRRTRMLERHREMIAKNKGEYLGVVDAQPDRMARCYLCSGRLEGRENPECLACGWMICRCGACGCGYKS